MNNLFPAHFGSPMTLLQSDTVWFADPSSNDLTGMLIVLGAIVIIGVVYSIVRRIKGGNKTSGRPSKFNYFAYRRIASNYGLNKEQKHLLEFVFNNSAVNDPEEAIENPNLLDKHFKRAFKTIERNSRSNEEVQLKLFRLFSLRNTIEAVPANSGGISSTNKLADNTPAILFTGKESYTVKVISAKGDVLVMEAPKSSLGTPVKVAKGSKVSLSFFSRSSKGFTFESKVLDNAITTEGPAIEIAHTKKAKPQVQRRFRREHINEACEFYLVFMDGVQKSKKKPPKLVVDKRRFTGTVLEISAGGCSLKTSAPIQVGSRLKMEIHYSYDTKIGVFGQVLRANRSGSIGNVIHVKFLKVPRRSYNNISAMVFGYDRA